MREKIVEAARKRFSHYGYSKTTMAEVASDCNMSPGNLYRYFPGKLDIAVEIGNETYEKLCAATSAAVSVAGPSAAARLKASLTAILDYTYNHVEYNEKLHEMGLILRDERPEFWLRLTQSHRKDLAQFLDEGRRSGEFAIIDPEWIATVIHSATLKFRYPQLHELVSLDSLKRELDTLLELILAGIRTGTAASASAADSRSERSAASASESPTYPI
jgi:AcrR family transcriptional regulator